MHDYRDNIQFFDNLRRNHSLTFPAALIHQSSQQSQRKIRRKKTLSTSIKKKYAAHGPHCGGFRKGGERGSILEGSTVILCYQHTMYM